MKVKRLIEQLKDYEEYTIESDSGWECGPTHIDAAYISHKDKRIILKQSVDERDLVDERYYKGYEVLYGVPYGHKTEEELKAQEPNPAELLDKLKKGVRK